MADVLDQACSAIEGRLKEIRKELRQLERAIGHMHGASSPRTRRRRRGSGAQSKAKQNSKRARRGQRKDQLVAALKENPGATPTELSKTIGISSSQVHALLRKAREEKAVVKSGKGYALKD